MQQVRSLGAGTFWQASGTRAAELPTGPESYSPDVQVVCPDRHPAHMRPKLPTSPDTRSSAVQDADGHGTHCAGSVGAVANNALGVAGVAGRVRLLGCKAIAGLDGHLVTSAAVRCLEYCASAGAHITSNSWGGQVRPLKPRVLCRFHNRSSWPFKLLGLLSVCQALCNALSRHAAP